MSKKLGAVLKHAGSAHSALLVRKKFKQWVMPKRRSVFIACMPKSGSTFLSKLIAEVGRLEIAHMTYAYERNEQELYLPALIDNYSKNTITQQHIKATKPNITLMREFGIRPIILVRNIFDVVVSIRDYLILEGVENFPSLYATKHFYSLSEHDQYDFIIANALPWYFNFYASWSDACKEGQIHAQWVVYDDLIEDWETGVGDIFRFYQFKYDHKQMLEAIQILSSDRKGSRINKGISGRGKEKLSAIQQAKVVQFSQYYPWVDFSSMGISH